MKFLAKIKKIFNLNKSDPRKATPHSESETRLAMPVTCLDLPEESINLSVNPIRERLEKDFKLGINMNECIKLLSLSDTELIDQQETLMPNYEEGKINDYSSSSEEEQTPKKYKLDYNEPNFPDKSLFMDQGQQSGTKDQQMIPRSEIVDENKPMEYRRNYNNRNKNEGSRNYDKRKQPYKHNPNDGPKLYES